MDVVTLIQSEKVHAVVGSDEAPYACFPGGSQPPQLGFDDRASPTLNGGDHSVHAIEDAWSVINNLRLGRDFGTDLRVAAGTNQQPEIGALGKELPRDHASAIQPHR
jgi:hypothetical protein